MLLTLNQCKSHPKFCINFRKKYSREKNKLLRFLDILGNLNK